ncbi:MAG: autotransporter assembly complex family protein [Alphaproteobacteria bacterium]
MLLLLMAVPAVAAETQEAPPAAPGPTVAYEASIEGDGEAELMDLLRQSSQLLTLADRPTSTLAGLERRVGSDVERLGRVLEAQGFYAAHVESAVDTGATPVAVRLTVTTGPVFLVGETEIAWRPAAPPELAVYDPVALGLPPGAVARAADVVAAERRLLARLGARGFPRASIDRRDFAVDRGATTLSANLVVDTGPRLTFGATRIVGLDDVAMDRARRYIAWQAGAVWDETKVEETRSAFAESGLFGSVRIDPDGEPAADGTQPVVIEVVEAPHRSIGGGGSWSSSEGFALKSYWEHRNLFGRAERLRLTATIGQILTGLQGHFRRPDLLENTDLLANGEAVVRDSDAFEETTFAAFSGLERRFGPHWKVSAGGSFDASDIVDRTNLRTRFMLYGLPLTASRDDADSLLDPTEGTRLTLTVIPYTGDGRKNLDFVLGRAAAAGYVPFDKDRRFVLALRGQIGSILGEETADIPATKRFYAGGGGSLRGFEYQKAGPLDATLDPVGGRSLAEVGSEMRVRIGDDWGAVAFIEGANVFDREVWPVGSELFWAAGFGVRYFTPVGPVRADIAFPLDPRPNIDDPWQIYLSLGQAF